MAKVGRNDPCPCGSGKKYKRCCLEKDETAERKFAATASVPQRQIGTVAAEIAERLAAGAYEIDETEDELATASNVAVDLVHAGRLDEADEASPDLLERFPGVHDGWDRLGMVYEAGAYRQKAPNCYPNVMDLFRARPADCPPQSGS